MPLRLRLPPQLPTAGAAPGGLVPLLLVLLLCRIPPCLRAAAQPVSPPSCPSVSSRADLQQLYQNAVAYNTPGQGRCGAPGERLRCPCAACCQVHDLVTSLCTCFYSNTVSSRAWCACCGRCHNVATPACRARAGRCPALAALPAGALRLVRQRQPWEAACPPRVCCPTHAPTHPPTLPSPPTYQTSFVQLHVASPGSSPASLPAASVHSVHPCPPTRLPARPSPRPSACLPAVFIEVAASLLADAEGLIATHLEEIEAAEGGQRYGQPPQQQHYGYAPPPY